jgi:ribosomal protein S12 methylthiotransferase accessory factor YcaO
MESDSLHQPRSRRRQAAQISSRKPASTDVGGYDSGVQCANDSAKTIPEAQGEGEGHHAKDHSSLLETDLKTLPRHTQVELAEFLLGHTLAETVEWLAEQGIGTTGPALSIFHATYTTRQQLLHFEAMVGILTAELAKQDPSLTPDRIRELGQSLFTRLAIEKKDAASWKITQELEMKRSKLDLEWQKFRSQASKPNADEDAASEKSEGLSPETTEKIERELKLF